MADNVLAYGFIDYANLAASRVAEVGAQQIYTAIETSARYHSDQLNNVLGKLCRRTTDFKFRYRLPQGGTLQPLDDKGKPLPTKGDMYYDVALPIQRGGTGMGMTWLAAAKATVQEVNSKVLGCLQQDADWMVRHALAAIFNNASWTYSDPEKGSLTIQPLAAADVTFPIIGASTEASQHYMASASAIADATNHYDTIYDQLMKHPANQIAGKDVVCFIPTGLVATTKGLADFVPVADPDIATGANSDRITAAQARIMGIQGQGDEVLGKVGRTWVVEWKRLPAGYIIGVALGNPDPVLGFREEPEASLQGLVTLRDGTAFTNETYFLRSAGFGVVNRIGAVVFRVGNGSYAIPTGYECPLAV